MAYVAIPFRKDRKKYLEAHMPNFNNRRTLVGKKTVMKKMRTVLQNLIKEDDVLLLSDKTNGAHTLLPLFQLTGANTTGLSKSCFSKISYDGKLFS